MHIELTAHIGQPPLTGTRPGEALALLLERLAWRLRAEAEGLTAAAVLAPGAAVQIGEDKVEITRLEA